MTATGKNGEPRRSFEQMEREVAACLGLSPPLPHWDEYVALIKSRGAAPRVSQSVLDDVDDLCGCGNERYDGVCGAHPEGFYGFSDKPVSQLGLEAG